MNFTKVMCSNIKDHLMSKVLLKLKFLIFSVVYLHPVIYQAYMLMRMAVS